MEDARRVVLYTCGQRKHAASLGHPCGRAAKALDEAGYEYELKVVGGYRLMPWTWASRSRERAKVEELSGQKQVPILLLDDGSVMSGSGTIAGWARENPHAR